MKTYKPHVSSVGDATANMIALMCYVVLLFFWSTGIVWLTIIFVVEKKSGLVRFHAMQAILLWVLRGVLGGGLPFEGLAALATKNDLYLRNPYGWEGSPEIIAYRIIVGGVIMLLAIMAAAHAYKWESWRILLVGQLAAYICRSCEIPQYMGGDTVPAECKTQEAATMPKNMDFAPATYMQVNAGNASAAQTVLQQAPPAQTAQPPQEGSSEQEPAPGNDIKQESKRKKRKKEPVEIVMPESPNNQLPPDMRDDIPLYLQLEKSPADAAKAAAEEERLAAEAEAAVQQAIIHNVLSEKEPAAEHNEPERIDNDMDNLDALVMGMADDRHISTQLMVEKVLSQLNGADDEQDAAQGIVPAEVVEAAETVPDAAHTELKISAAPEDPSSRLPLDMKDPPIPSDMY